MLFFLLVILYFLQGQYYSSRMTMDKAVVDQFPVPTLFSLSTSRPKRITLVSPSLLSEQKDLGHTSYMGPINAI